MNELTVERRRRSVSKTPFLRSSCDHESCDDVIHIDHNKQANVPTIVEETDEVAFLSAPSSNRMIQSILKTSDYHSDDSPENRIKTASGSLLTEFQEQQVQTNCKEIEFTNMSTVTSTTTTSSTVTVNPIKSEVQCRSSLFATSTPKNHICTNDSTKTLSAFSEHSYNSYKNQQNTYTNETQRAINSQSGVLNNKGTNRVSSLRHSLASDSQRTIHYSKHLAYWEYKNAGEYWNNTPKTDYTYSKFSKDRRMLAPGVVAMPNMSRISLAKFRENNNANNSNARTAQNELEHQRQQRYNLNYDSEEDDFDFNEHYSEYRTNSYHNYKVIQHWFVRFITAIIGIVSHAWCSLLNVSSLDSYNISRLYKRIRIKRQKDFISYVTWPFIVLYRLIALLITSALYFDTWLLQTSKPNNTGRKRFFLLLLILLPILLLAASYCYNGNSTNMEEQKHLQTPFISNADYLKANDGNRLWPLDATITTSNATMKSSPILKGNLSAQGYDLLKHLNNYVQKLIAAQLQQHKQQEHQILDSDKIFEIILEKLETSDIMHRIEELQILFKKQSEMVKRLDTDSIMQHISQSIKEYVNEMVIKQFIYEEYGDKLQYLQQQLDLIKLSMNSKERTKDDKSEHIKIIVNELQDGQNDLLKRFQQQATIVDERFKKIFVKLLTLENEQFSLMNQQIKMNLIEMFGLKKFSARNDNFKINELNSENLQEWLHQLFVARDYLEERLLVFANQTNKQLQQDINHSSAVLMRDISEKLEEMISKLLEQERSESGQRSNVLAVNQLKTIMTEDTVKNIVKSVLAIYDADKTGLVDFALESAGGQILSTRCTENYQTKSAQISIFGIPLWYPNNTPRIVISPNVQPGECWAFQGFPGFLVLKLHSLVYVTGFTMEHIPKVLVPNGRIDSAPKNFTVWGLQNENDPDPILLGDYEFKDDDAASLQYFSVQNLSIDRPFEIVELRIESNHGHPLYTCLYRFRVHGKSSEMP